MNIGGQEWTVKEALLSARKLKIKSILTTGLQGGAYMRDNRDLVSASPSTSANRIDGVVVNPEFHWDNGIPRMNSGDSFRFLNKDEEAIRLSGRVRELMLSDVLHRGNSSVFGVVIERFYEKMDQLANLSEEELEERALSSFLVVASFEDVQRTKDMPRDKLEYPIEPPLLPSNFSHAFIPRQFEEIFDSVLAEIDFDKKRILSVDSVPRTLFVPRTIKIRDFEDIDKEVPTILEVPDYYRGLEDIIRQNAQKPYWIHGVRLPTEADLMHNYLIK